MAEELSDEDRDTLSEIHEGCVALRIIDALAADRSALVAQLEALKAAEFSLERRTARVRELEETLRVERIGREESVLERNDAEADVSDLRTRIAELEAVLDQETKARLEAEAALSSMARLRDIAEQRMPAILRFRERVDADQS